MLYQTLVYCITRVSVLLPMFSIKQKYVLQKEASVPLTCIRAMFNAR